MMLDTTARGAGWPLEAGVLFCNYLFKNFNFRKLYVEVPGFNFGQLERGLGRFFEEEGRLSEHDYYDGRYWDLVIMTLDRGSGANGIGARVASAAERFARGTERHAL